MKDQVKIVCGVLLAVFMNCCASETPPETRPPNVLLIMTDDQGFGDVRVHGNDSIDTPVQDRLAKEGVRMNHFYVSPVCAPTRASLLTGRYHYRTGTTWMTRNGEAMRSEEVTLAEVFKANGYATGCFGKWHNGAHYPQNAQGQGFDTFVGFSAGHWNRYHDTDLEVDGKMQKVKGYITDVFTEAAQRFILDNQDQPFFAYVPYNAPHTPLIAPESLFEKYRHQGLSIRNASIYGMIESVDQNIGRLLRTLEETELLDQTLVIFMTDNGPNGNRYRAGMKGTKSSVSDGGVRVPCFFYWKNQLKGGRIIDELTAHIDILPTLVDLLDLQPIPTLPLDGISFAPLLHEESAVFPDRTLYTFSTNRNKYKGSIRNRQFRLTVNGADNYALTRLMSDPGENLDLKEELPAEAEKMYRDYLRKYEEVTDGLGAFLPIPVGYSQAPLVELPAHEGFPSGEIRFQSSAQGWGGDWFVNWHSEQDTIYWNVDVVQKGTYRISLRYSCPPEQTGSEIQVRAGDASTSAVLADPFIGEVFTNREQMSRGRVANDQTWGELNVGVIELAAGEQRISLCAKKIAQQEVAKIKGLRLFSEK